MNLIGRIPKGKRKPEYLVDDEALDAMAGKYVLMFFGSEELYGPFDSLEQAQEWAKARKEMS